MLVARHTCELMLENPLRCNYRAQAPPTSPLAGVTQQEDSRTRTFLCCCHLRIKKLHKVGAVIETDFGDAVGPSRS